MIRDCPHLPKVNIGGWVLSVCWECRQSNIQLYHSRDEAMARHPAKGRRRSLYLTRDLREPTKEDFHD